MCSVRTVVLLVVLLFVSLVFDYVAQFFFGKFSTWCPTRQRLSRVAERRCLDTIRCGEAPHSTFVSFAFALKVEQLSSFFDCNVTLEHREGRHLQFLDGTFRGNPTLCCGSTRSSSSQTSIAGSARNGSWLTKVGGLDRVTDEDIFAGRDTRALPAGVCVILIF